MSYNLFQLSIGFIEFSGSSDFISCLASFFFNLVPFLCLVPCAFYLLPSLHPPFWVFGYFLIGPTFIPFILTNTNIMLHDSVLRRSAHRVANYIQRYVTLVGAEDKEEVFALFDTMHQLFPHLVIVTCPV